MPMYKWMLGLVLGLFGVCAQAGQPLPDHVRLVSEYWVGYTNRDGSGLAWEIMREVFGPAGVRVDQRNVPYTRSVGLVQRGEADAWLGSYLGEVRENVIYPRWPYDADPIVALGLVGKPVPDLQSLKTYRLAWMRGYGYQKYLPGPLEFQEIERRSGILGMLERGHADFYIDAFTEAADLLKSGPQPERFRITSLTRLPLYVGFADTARGRALADLFDRRMAELVQSDKLRAIFHRWQQPYPFDEDMERPDASP